MTICTPSTLFSSGVMVAHLIPTLYFFMASAQSTVTAEGGEGVGVTICIHLIDLVLHRNLISIVVM